MIPLFGPVPGGLELLVILVMAILMFGLPLTIFGGLFLLYRRSKTESASKDDVAELKDEVTQLREEIRRRDEEDGHDDRRRDDGSGQRR
ncbi:hypothetical protein [Haladaptatus sp. NG-WS-4]